MLWLFSTLMTSLDTRYNGFLVIIFPIVMTDCVVAYLHVQTIRVCLSVTNRLSSRKLPPNARVQSTVYPSYLTHKSPVLFRLSTRPTSHISVQYCFTCLPILPRIGCSSDVIRETACCSTPSFVWEAYRDASAASPCDPARGTLRLYPAHGSWNKFDVDQ